MESCPPVPWTKVHGGVSTPQIPVESVVFFLESAVKMSSEKLRTSL